MFVTKSTGEKQPFRPEKIINTCLRAGAPKDLAYAIAHEVGRRAHDGISTKKILRLTLRLLEEERPSLAARYDLKDAIARLGPAGYQFEIFIAEILKEYGYRAQLPPPVRGACVEHEIDIIAEKNGVRAMIECKYRRESGIYIGIKEALYTWARFLDLKDGYTAGKCQKFDKCWLVCNTRFSDDVSKYAHCKQMVLLGWHYPRDKGLERMIEDKKIYPITVLRKLDQDSRKKLAKAELMLCRDLQKTDFYQLEKMTKIKADKLIALIQEARDVLSD